MASLALARDLWPAEKYMLPSTDPCLEIHVGSVGCGNASFGRWTCWFLVNECLSLGLSRRWPFLWDREFKNHGKTAWFLALGS